VIFFFITAAGVALAGLPLAVRAAGAEQRSMAGDRHHRRGKIGGTLAELWAKAGMNC